MTATLVPPGPIPATEFAERRRRAVAVAADAGLDGILAWSSRT